MMDLRKLSLILSLFTYTIACSTNTSVDDKKPNYCQMNVSVIPTDILFKLFTRENSDCQLLYINDIEGFKNSNFDLNKPVKIYIHGYSPRNMEEIEQDMKKAFLENTNANFLTVDWRVYANVEFNVAQEKTEYCGRKVAEFIDWLISLGVEPSLMHVVGHSLGAHISGFVGRFMKNGRLGYITASDPAAGRFWRHNPDRLNKDDAEYVEVIHTNTRKKGFLLPLGQADFYVNGGAMQPYCQNEGDMIDACSHITALRYFLESLNSDCFLGYKCSSYEEYLLARELCWGTALMGGRIPKRNAHGVYYLNTHDVPPFGICEDYYDS